jgi:hypothetical protein
MPIKRRINVSLPADPWLPENINRLKWGIVEEIEKLGYIPRSSPTRGVASASRLPNRGIPSDADDIARRCAGARSSGARLGSSKTYGKWREYDPEDTVRFYALRLHGVGMLKTTPQKLIAQGTDWRFVNELKKELKG